MFRNDVVMTPLRVKQAIDSRFVKPSEYELNVLINGTWVEFVNLPPVVNCAELLTMYKGDTTLTETPVINATGCTSLREVFRGCRNLETVKYIHTSNVADMNGTFRECSSLTSTPPLDVSNVTNMSYMFQNCSSLTSVTFTGDVVPPHGGTFMLWGTPIRAGNGYIFVPDNMVDAYKTASGWSAHASVIKGISEQEGLQSDIMSFNLMIEENPTMFVMTEEEEEELM